MTIVVTGAGGFIGRELVRRLVAAGEMVVGVDSSAAAIPGGARAVAGDICAAAVRAEALRDGCEKLVHLATIAGGAAEADPAASRRVNIDAMLDLLEQSAAAGHRPRLVYASSIAVLGERLPAGGVDDLTPVSPKLIYGGHKAMMEIAVATYSNRGAIDGVTVRLPAVLARPKGPSGMTSAFMSDLFHALRAAEPFVCPVSREATIWAQSVDQCVANLIHAVTLVSALLPPTRAVTLPALRIRIGDLVAEIARQAGADASLVRYRPDAALEAQFGAYPPLATPAAENAGFADDGALDRLVRRALSHAAPVTVPAVRSA